MFGWMGKVARIDVSCQSLTIEEPPIETYGNYLGGRGLAGHYLRNQCTFNWYDPAMPLLLFTGPLVGTPSPTSGRMTIMSRSPLTGTVGDCSVGGNLGTELKRAGWDGLIITGRSDRLIGIEIIDERVFFADASGTAGNSADALSRRLSERGATAVIGPAAENGVLFANIIVDGHFAAGRNGLGCVMAEKGVKYITVKGSGATAVHDPVEVKAASEDVRRLIAASPALLGPCGISRYGTQALFDLTDIRAVMPTDNFRKTRFSEAPHINAHAYQERYKPRKSGCRGCHIRCKQRFGAAGTLPEFETMSHFSALLCNDDIETVVKAHEICNAAGMDTISAAVTLACHAEITNERLRPDEIISLLSDIGDARGLGKELGRGAARYALSRGRPDLAMTVKNQEIPAYDPRGVYGMALAYATSTRGACHLRAYPISHEILRKPVPTDRFSFDGKARIIKISEDANAVIDSLTACKFVFFGATLEEYARIFQAVTGLKCTFQDLLHIGDRIYYQERIMNSMNGFSAFDDDLPQRFFTEPADRFPSGETPPLSRSDFLNARSDYYRIRGLDNQGNPREDKARSLGLSWKA
ncbi:MAG: aldehyde ferredoxin oxidoreductase family protein [Deltaproteobacteria bacterium]|nr:aldehyde ferredoxin oxidoreductase family protein [Deltaproteobacteria bacterium]